MAADEAPRVRHSSPYAASSANGSPSIDARQPHKRVPFGRRSGVLVRRLFTLLAEVLAALDIPAKISVPAFAVARLIYADQWDAVQEACECDVISTALLLAQ